MNKKKSWQLWVILGVMGLTLYNILPTLFYYAHPLKKPVSEKEGVAVAQQIAQRVNNLETFTIDWLRTLAHHLNLKPTAIVLDPTTSQVAKVSFSHAKDARRFADVLWRAGPRIPFVPAQLAVDRRSWEEGQTTVFVQRKLGTHFSPEEMHAWFTVISKRDENGGISPLYHEQILERALPIALSLGVESSDALAIAHVDTLSESELLRLSREILEVQKTFGAKDPIAHRFFARLTAAGGSISGFTHRLETLLHQKQQDVKTWTQAAQSSHTLSDVQAQEQAEIATAQSSLIQEALGFLKEVSPLFQPSHPPLSESVLRSLLSEEIPETGIQIVNLEDGNPFVSSLRLDWNHDVLDLILYPEVSAIRSAVPNSEAVALHQERLNQLLFQELAFVAQQSHETWAAHEDRFTISWNDLIASQSLLALNLTELYQKQADQIRSWFQENWKPKTLNLQLSEYPIFSFSEYQQQDGAKKKLGFVFYAPKDRSVKGFQPGSLYVIARNMGYLDQTYQDLPLNPDKQQWIQDQQLLQQLLLQQGFVRYSAQEAHLSEEFAKDWIFELQDAQEALIAATRESFHTRGSKKWAILEFTDIEQRILTRNRIETAEQEDLVKWQEEYQQARVALNPAQREEIPPPNRSVLWNNCILSAKKYFRGDDRKILKWGLDLSGGKTVRIGLKDSSGHSITDEADLKQARDELYQRVNRLGLSEVALRTEGATMVLDFPGSQGFAAQDLIQASAMYFHVVNEKFGPSHAGLAHAVETFLQEVWSEAVMTQRTDLDSLQAIAWHRLGGRKASEGLFLPMTEHAQLLYQHGLRFAEPGTYTKSHAFDETFSSLAVYRGSELSDWHGQSHPLLIVFANYALEGSNLQGIQTAYDPKDGNSLHFGVVGSAVSSSGEPINPREAFYQWTSHFSEEKIIGTPLEAYSRGQGWRMAVILNGSVISAPALHSPLKDSARISGSFSQREITQLAADLKAGSLSFTPEILSEENISPELGTSQRHQAIGAGILAIVLVIATMSIYYRFGGVVASVAVFINLLIIWAVLQNLHAALTLPGIAGIILALGMSVDANVLVFERMREELRSMGSLLSAIQAGYRKAFSAILDSNLTTLIAAFILLNFDSGPIKGFALTLIIGVISSMFTALFMTRVFFTHWAEGNSLRRLHFMELFKDVQFPFLRYARPALWGSLLFLCIGLGLVVAERSSLFGMDFTGGYSLTVDLQPRAGIQYKEEALEALVHAGAARHDIHIQELNHPNQLRMALSSQLKAWDLSSPTDPMAPVLFPYQKDHRITWIVHALELGGVPVNPDTLPTLDQHWTQTSGQLSSAMKNQALFGLGFAFLSIFIYLVFRFEYPYAISATLGLLHDLLITVGVLALLHLFFPSIQIDLQMIGALMMIVGYSLNDTIIIFDRIREDLKRLRHASVQEVIHHALNVTLGRTVMTSGSTLLVLLALVLFGGAAIFNFSLIMLLGIAIGTLSSLFIAAPLFLFFYTKRKGHPS